MSGWIGLVGVVVGGLLAMLGPALLAWRKRRSDRLEVFIAAAVAFAGLEDRSRSIIWEARHLNGSTDDLRWSKSDYDLVYNWLKVNSPNHDLCRAMEGVQDAGREFQRVWRESPREPAEDFQVAFDRAEQAHRDALVAFVEKVRHFAERSGTVRVPRPPTLLAGVPPR